MVRTGTLVLVRLIALHEYRSPWRAAQSELRHDAIWLAGGLAVTALPLAIIFVATLLW